MNARHPKPAVADQPLDIGERVKRRSIAQIVPQLAF